MLFLVVVMVVLVILTKMVSHSFKHSIAPSPLPPPPPAPPSIAEVITQMKTLAPSMGKIVLSKADNGKTVIIGLDETVRIILPGNATTGFFWRITNSTGKTVQVISPNKKFIYESSPHPINFAGGGGFYHIDLMSGTDQGPTTFYFIYDRPFDEKKFGYDYSITLDVRKEKKTTQHER